MACQSRVALQRRSIGQNCRAQDASEQWTLTNHLPAREVENDNGNGDSQKSPQAGDASRLATRLVVGKSLLVGQLLLGKERLLGE